MYLIVKEGIYLQGIFGVFSDKDKAIADVDKLAAADVDDYHEWHAVEIEPDKLLGFEEVKDPFFKWRDLKGLEIIHTAKGGK